MDIILLVAHVCLALGIITLVLLQKGKGASEGAAFGGGGAGSVFGASGSSNFLSKSTAIFATLFFCNSIALAYMAAHRDTADSVVDSITQIEQSVETANERSLTESLNDLIPAADKPVAADDTDVPPAIGAGLDQGDAADAPPPAAE